MPAIRTAALALAAATCAAAVLPAAASARSTVERCAAADLAAATRPLDGSAGHAHLAVTVRNVSGRSCRLFGYPGLGLLDGVERALPGRAVFDRTVRPRTVILAAGGRAHADVSYSTVPTGSERCRRSTFLLVTPPDRRTSLEVRAVLAPCGGGELLVRPFRAGR